MDILYFFNLFLVKQRFHICLLKKLWNFILQAYFVVETIEKESGVRIQTISYIVGCMEPRKTVLESLEEMTQ